VPHTSMLPCGFEDGGKLSPTDPSVLWWRTVGSGDGKHLLAGTKIEYARDEQALAVVRRRIHEEGGLRAPCLAGVPARRRFWGLFGERLKPEDHYSGREAVQGARFLARL